MCGFVVLRNLGGRSVAVPVLERMARTLRHRGPDDDGTFVEGAVGLGFRRLSILDLSDAGHQPMLSPDASAVLVFNGEIFNYVELRDELAGLGHRFRSTGDAEVLLHAYLEWGTECLSHLNGEWAFVVYDLRDGSLFGARDRVGVKPLYRVETKEETAWASEIKALLALPGYRAAINWRTAGAYLASGQLDETNETFFEGISAVPPAGAFTVDREGRRREWRYWSIPEPGGTDAPSDPARRFADLFEDAVRIRLRSDVPLGVCLSGGLDSTAVICAMHRLQRSGAANGGRVVAFNYHHPDFDEQRYVEATIAQTGALLHRLEMDHVGLWDLAERVVRANDEPVHTLTAMVGYQLMQMIAERGVRVILNGQGADETLAGYDSYYRDAWYTAVRRAHPGRAWTSIREHTAAHGGRPLPLFLATVRRAVQSELRRARWYRTLAHRRHLRLAGRNGWLTEAALPSPAAVPDYEPVDLDSVLRRSTTVAPLPLYLRVEDRNSMAHSVEVRLPMLDHRLIELAFSLADDWKMRPPWNKFVLREAMRGRIPETVRSRVDKMGFPSPTSRLLSQNTFDALFELVASQPARERGVYAWDRMIADLEAHRGLDDPALSLRFFRVAQVELWAGIHGL